MNAAEAVAVKGRKTFFVGADAGLVSDAYLEQFLAYGYEAYRVFGAHPVPDIEERLDLLLQLVAGAALVFFVDAFAVETDWTQVIRGVKKRHADTPTSVIYMLRGVEAQNQAVEAHWRTVVGTAGTCARIFYQRSRNFSPLLSLLAAMGANGCRHTVRALCGALSSVTLMYNGERVTAAVQDISLNHFSCMLSSDARLEIVPKTLFLDALFQVNGSRFFSDCIFVTERMTSHGLLYTFMFSRKDGAAGLDDAVSARFCPKLYQMVTAATSEQLEEAFSLRTRIMRGGKATDVNGTVLRELAALQQKHDAAAVHT